MSRKVRQTPKAIIWASRISLNRFQVCSGDVPKLVVLESLRRLRCVQGLHLGCNKVLNTGAFIIRIVFGVRFAVTVIPIKLETGLRPNSAGLLLRIEAIGFPTIWLLLYSTSSGAEKGYSC